MTHRSIIPLLALALVACNDSPTATVANDIVRVTLEESGLRIENLTDEPRAYSANDPDWLAVAVVGDFTFQAACSTPDTTCLRLAARSSKLVPFNEVGGYGASTKSIVVWTWRVVPSTTPGQYEPRMDEGVTLKL